MKRKLFRVKTRTRHTRRECTTHHILAEEISTAMQAALDEARKKAFESEPDLIVTHAELVYSDVIDTGESEQS